MRSLIRGLRRTVGGLPCDVDYRSLLAPPRAEKEPKTDRKADAETRKPPVKEDRRS